MVIVELYQESRRGDAYKRSVLARVLVGQEPIPAVLLVSGNDGLCAFVTLPNAQPSTREYLDELARAVASAQQELEGGALS